MKRKPIRPKTKKTGTVVYGDSIPFEFDYGDVEDEAKEYIDRDEDPVGKIIKSVKQEKLVITSDGTTKNTHIFIDGVEIVGCNWIIFEADSAKPVISINLKLQGVKR